MRICRRRGLFLLVAGVAAECARRSKFTKLVAYHVFSNIDRDELVAVVDCESVAYEVRRNHRGAAPCLDNRLLAGFIHSGHFLLKLTLINGPFLSERLILVS